jgi:hypothetical protein
MLLRPTTFILGAGASVDMKFPTGAELQVEVTKRLARARGTNSFANEKIWNALQPLLVENNQNWSVRAQQFLKAADSISRGMSVAASIDNFLHTHSDDLDVVILGKLSIALCILEKEEACFLASRSGIPSINADILAKPEFQNSWYAPFVRMLTAGTSSNDPLSFARNARFIVFNYDRCLEIVLLLALQSYYRLELKEAAEIMKQIDIVHPYGSLGTLPPLGSDGVGFGQDAGHLLEISQKLKTFTESIDSELAVRAKEAVSRAQTLVFLGFGFLQQNMSLIAPEAIKRATRVHATTIGISESDQLVVATELFKFVEEGRRFANVMTQDSAAAIVDVANGTCRNLIENHRMRLLQA